MYDIYDYIEVVYRILLFITPCGALAYLSYNFALIFNGNFIAEVLITFIWLVFCIAIASYILFIAQGTFRPKKNQEYLDTYHCFEYLRNQEKF